MTTTQTQRRANISGARREMKKGDEPALAARQSAGRAGGETDENVKRAEEDGEADEADAPTAEEENVGMNTVLDANPLFGVQDDASEK